MSELNLDALAKALKQLDDGLEQAELDPGNALLRDGVIQRFEYSMDLSWKMLQRYLKTIAQLEESRIQSKKDIFREAARSKLLLMLKFGLDIIQREMRHLILIILR